MADSKLISAQDMRRAVATDPQFTAPVRPALCRGLVLLPIEGGLLVEGSPTRQILRGTATRDLIPKLLPLLDGTRDQAEIAEAAGVPVEHVAQVVALLYTCGLLEEGDPSGTHPADGAEAGSGAAHAARYWSRSLDSTRVNRNTAEVLDRLRGTRVAVAGDAGFGAEVTELLVAAGMERTAQVDASLFLTEVPSPFLSGVPSEFPSDGRPDLVVALTEDSSTSLSGVAAWCAEHDVPLIPARLTDGMLDVGPYIDTNFTVSFADAERQRVTAPAPAERSYVPVPAVRRALAASLVANQVTTVVGRVGSAPVLRGLLRADLVEWTQTVHVVAEVPEVTDARSTLTEAGVPLALAFEASVGFPPRKLLNPRDHQAHYKPGNIALQHDSKRWPSARTLELPREGAFPYTPLGLDAPEPATGVDLAQLSSVLLRGAGLRDEAEPTRQVQRWNPTGGNLGSVQLHVVADGVAGLENGTWGYLTHSHRLARLSPATDAGTGHTGQPVAVVLTGALARVASKYSGFAWRVVHLDAGVAIAQMSHVARSLGLDARPLDRWDDLHLADLLDLDLDAEPVTGVLLLRPSAAKES
ncbi:nitroreductase family protein [Streptomyces sp. NPDC051162]|uniref:nitroreductase family protein n=1 Tax=Streptomyces sp. NPDC051162 TaxID=3154747 RepID=UPI0034165E52